MRVLTMKAALQCGAAVSVLLWSGVAFAQERSFDIPSEEAVKAIPEFARQADVQIVAPADQLKGVTTPAVKGVLDLHIALKRLLVGTSIEIASDDGQTIVLQTTSKNLRTNRDEDETPEGSSDVETVVVVGSRIPQIAKEGAQEVRTYTKAQIDQSGQSTVSDFLNTLPEVSTSNIDSELGSYADQTTVQLHGLPIGTTLVLLNGRRVEINNYGFFDLNNIPVAAIERVEVLPVGSSAVYGADSLGGAVNIVLKQDFTGLDASVRYGHANGADETDINLAGGYSWGRGSFSVVASYQTKGELAGTERAITRDPNNLLATYFGQDDICNPGTAYSLDGSNLPGLSSPMAAIPSGLSGKPSIADFSATAGTVNKCSIIMYSDLLPPANREGVLASGEYKLADWAVLFTEVMFSHENVRSRVGNLISFYNAYGSVLPATNAFNPFGEDVGISYTYSGLPFNYARSMTFVRPLVGVRGDLGGDWVYEITGSLSYDSSNVSQNDNWNTTAWNNALASSDPATAFNVFAQGAPGSQQFLATLFGPPLILRFDSQNFTTEGVVRGPLLHLDSGAVQAVFGAEYDHSRLYTHQQDVAITSAANVAKRDAYSLFSEVRVPLWANHENPANGDKLAIGLAGRFDHSDDYGSKTTGQGTVEFRPFETLLIRGGFAMAYQAPQLTQLAGASGSYAGGGYIDTLRGNAPVNNVELTFGPNPNLKPETGESRQLGFVYSSDIVPGLTVGVTYWSIGISNYIGTPSPQDLINYPNLFPDAVTRGTPSAQDTQNGYPGPITEIRDVYYNFGKIDVSGFDFDASYTADTVFGRLTPTVSVTETYKFNSAISPSLPQVSSVSQATYSVGFAPRWKGTAGLAWTSGPYTLHLDGRYVGRYRDYQDYIPNSNELGNFVLWDANFRYDMGQGLAADNKWLSGTYVELGGVNLFNTMPQKSLSFSNFDYAEADIRGRFIYVRLGRNF